MFHACIVGMLLLWASLGNWTFSSWLFRYLIFYCPHELAYRCLCFLPIRLMIAGMKEVTRTWKITGGIVHAHKRFADAWLIMIGVGWARGNTWNLFLLKLIFELFFTCFYGECLGLFGEERLTSYKTVQGYLFLAPQPSETC